MIEEKEKTKNNMAAKKKRLKPGEIIRLSFDEAFKFMFGNNEHKRILIMLLSKILRVPYEKLAESTIDIQNPYNSNSTLGEKKTESDIVVTIKKDEKINTKVMLEMNINYDYYETVINRNTFYFSHMSAIGMIEGETYKNLPVNILVNFNNTSLNHRGLILDEYMYRNIYGDILTDKYKILQIDIEKAYQLWYNNIEERVDSDNYLRDLTLIAASLTMTSEEEFKKCISEVNMNPEIKSEIEKVLEDMCSNKDLVIKYFEKDEEMLLNGIKEEIEERVTERVTKEATKEATSKTKKEMIINMYNQNKLSLKEIADISELPSSEVENIINDYIKEKKSN